MFGTKKTQTRNFDRFDLEELQNGIEAGRLVPSADTTEILDALAAGRYDLDMAIAAFRVPTFAILAR